MNLKVAQYTSPKIWDCKFCNLRMSRTERKHTKNPATLPSSTAPTRLGGRRVVIITIELVLLRPNLFAPRGLGRLRRG